MVAVLQTLTNPSKTGYIGQGISSVDVHPLTVLMAALSKPLKGVRVFQSEACIVTFEILDATRHLGDDNILYRIWKTVLGLLVAGDVPLVFHCVYNTNFV